MMKELLERNNCERTFYILTQQKVIAANSGSEFELGKQVKTVRMSEEVS